MRRQRAQSVVEFGGVIVFLTLLIAAVIDFGVLMNEWLTVASDARQLARDASVGRTASQLVTEANAFPIPGVTTDNFFTKYCCDAGNPGDALVLSVIYYDQCIPGAGPTCHEIPTVDLGNQYGFPAAHRGTCSTVCTRPARPSPNLVGSCTSAPCPGDSVQITFSASRAHMLTPILQGMCNPAPAACMTLQNTVIMRFDGSGL